MTVAAGEAKRRLLAARSTDTLRSVAAELAAELLDGDRGEFLVEEGDRLVPVASTAPDGPEPDRSYPMVTGIPGQAYASERSCVISDLHDIRSSTATTAAASAVPARFRSLCCVPIGDDGLLLVSDRAPGAFSDDDLAVMEDLAEWTRSAISRLREDPAEPVANGGRRPEVAEYQDRLDHIADILSHDGRNALTVIRGRLALAQDDDVADEELARASAAVDRLEGLIDEVALLARTGDLEADVDRVDLADAARAAWETFESEAAELEIDGSATLVANELCIDHILGNLFENAVSHGGSEVTVRVGPLEDGFFVEDDGPGIPPDDADRIFDRGYSGAGASSGLGLNIVKRVAEANGWTVRVAESASGGARFEIRGLQPAT